MRHELLTHGQVPDLTSWIYDPNFMPRFSQIQASGTCHCPLVGRGTLGPRVRRAPNNHFYYLATYHNFGLHHTEFNWVYYDRTTKKRVEHRAGKVINRKYLWGPNRIWPKVDCALIQLDTKSEKGIKPGIFRTCGAVTGARIPRVGEMVFKYGQRTGSTYGKVVTAPTGLEDWVIQIELTDRYGYPRPGTFSKPGDSGAPVVFYDPKTERRDQVAGIVVKEMLACRIDRVTEAMGASLHID